ncbi:PP2C family protein-serine/threonine phosphatase [Janibacter sp. G1551]|uniref:PP2C family protein-serine/threonine phosphatase n=1 Tax=Janibacter sp. G1551 TaxID=3420440 RepID=UPI003D0168B0
MSGGIGMLRPRTRTRSGPRVSVFGRLGQAGVLALLIAVTAAGSAGLVTWPDIVPSTFFAPIIVLGGMMLGPRPLLVLYSLILVALVVPWGRDDGFTPAAIASRILIAVVMVMLYALSRSHHELGVHGLGGNRMLVDLRGRLGAMSELPRLPQGWRAESALESANGDSFSGDFLVTTRNASGSSVELVLVDVSGKGVGAGTRSLLLSGAFSGLLGMTEPERFLGAANAYLIRQQWSEGFATAVHLQLCTDTGAFTVGSAGHPPALRYDAGTGRWSPTNTSTGPPLGVMPSPDYPRHSGILRRGDALLLYTDGVIESRTRRLADGIDWMLGTAEQALGSGGGLGHRPTGFQGLAARICRQARAGKDDDRAVVIVWRE